MDEKIERERIVNNRVLKLEANIYNVGEDICVIITGGSKPHIGCVCISQSRKSMKTDEFSCTTSTFNFLGHKDDIIGKRFSEALSSYMNKNVVVICGIHVDNISANEIETFVQMGNELLETIKASY